MRRHHSAVLFLVIVLLLFMLPLLLALAESEQCQLTILPAEGGTTFPPPGNYTYDQGRNVTISATPNNGQSFEHWIINDGTVDQNPVTLQITHDQTVQPVFTGDQGNLGGADPGSSFNVPGLFILILAIAIIACCFVGYLVPVGVAIRRRKTPPSVIKTRLILSLASIAIIVGLLGGTLIIYGSNLTGIFAPSNIDKVTNVFSSQSGGNMLNLTGTSFNSASKTLSIAFDFTNPTATNLTLSAFLADLTDHLDGYPMGVINLANPVVAGPNQTIAFQATCVLNQETMEHVAASHADGSSLDIDLSNIYIDCAGLMLRLNETTTLNIGSILG